MPNIEPSKTIVHLVRHGEVMNPDNILYARIPRFRMSRTGIKQAKRAGDYFTPRNLAMIYHSPMLRARQTARYIAAHQRKQVKVKSSALLNEIYTPYEGEKQDRLAEIDWNIYENIDPDFEQPEDILLRVKHFSQRVRREHLGKEIVAVTHGDVIVFAQLWANNLELTHENRMAISEYPGHGSVTTLTFVEDGSALPNMEYTRIWE